MVKRKRTKGQTILYKTLHIKLKIEQHEPHLKPEVNSGDLKGQWYESGLAVSVMPFIASSMGCMPSTKSPKSK